MIISRLRLKNWRNFLSADVALTSRVFVIGPNASGKSNLLDVMRFLRDIARPGGGLQHAISQRGGLSKIRCLAARRDPLVEIEVDLAGSEAEPPAWRYAIGITRESRGHRQAKLRFERVWKGGALLLDRPDQSDASDAERTTQTHLEQISANADFREIARFFESIRYLHLIPQLLRHPEAFQGAGQPDDPYGRNFLELIAKTPRKTKDARLKRIEAALREAVPSLTKLVDVKDEAGIPHLEALYEHWRPNAGLQREDQFSDGTLRLIGLFWSLLDGESPLLLEEPELSLHREIVSRLPPLFSRLQRRTKRQIFVSTHSWDLLNDKGIGGEETVMLVPGREGTQLRLASGNPELRRMLVAGLTIADAVLPQTAPPKLDQFSSFE